MIATRTISISFISSCLILNGWLFSIIKMVSYALRIGSHLDYTVSMVGNVMSVKFSLTCIEFQKVA